MNEKEKKMDENTLQIIHTLSLLSSMVNSGEEHSLKSKEMLSGAFEAIMAIQDDFNEILDDSK